MDKKKKISKTKCRDGEAVSVTPDGCCDGDIKNVGDSLANGNTCKDTIADDEEYVEVVGHEGSASSSSSNYYTWSKNAFRSQVIDFFGEIAGISFTPEHADSLFIGNAGLITN